MTPPRVSVVVPGRDVGSYVADAMTSLARQFADRRDLEVVVVDDGSVDDTTEVATSFSSRLARLTVLTNSEPQGISAARNRGVAATTGRYLAFLDADDWLAPGHLAHLADAMDVLRVPFLRTDHTTVHGGRRQLVRAPQAVRGERLDPRGSILPVDDRTMVDYPYSWAGLFDRALVQDDLLSFREDLRTAEDRPWIWSLFLRGGSYAVVDAPGIRYRRGLPASLSQTYDSRQLDVVPALHATYDVLEADPDYEVFLPKLVRTTAGLLSHHLRRSRQMPSGAHQALREGAATLIGRIPDDVLAYETARMHPGRIYMLQGLLPALDAGLRHRPPACLRLPPSRAWSARRPHAGPTIVLAADEDEALVATAALSASPVLKEGRHQLVLTGTGTEPAPEVVESAYDRVERLGDVLAPGEPDQDLLPMLEKLVRGVWDLGTGPVRLVVPALDGPSRTVARLLHDAPIYVASGRPQTYAPDPTIPLDVSQRVRSVHHVELLAGVEPLLAAQVGAPAVVIPSAEIDRVAGGRRQGAELRRRLRENEDGSRTAGLIRTSPPGVAGLLAATSYVSAPDELPWLRDHAERFLSTTDLDLTGWIRIPVLAELGLPRAHRLSLQARLRRLAYRSVRHPVAGHLSRLADLLRVRHLVGRALHRLL